MRGHHGLLRGRSSLPPVLVVLGEVHPGEGSGGDVMKRGAGVSSQVAATNLVVDLTLGLEDVQDSQPKTQTRQTGFYPREDIHIWRFVNL